MNKRKIEYYVLILVFILFLFRNNFLAFLIKKDQVLNTDIITDSINKTLIEENNSLHALLDYKIENNYQYKISKVLYRDIYDFKNEITIYKGTMDNLKENDVVINDLGLIGVISKVYKEKALVKLITNKDSNISVKINDSYGILKTKENKLIVSNLTNYDLINLGDKIYTSGIGNLPGNILIGTVKEINMDNLEIEKIITINPSVDFNHLNYVFIVGRE